MCLQVFIHAFHHFQWPGGLTSTSKVPCHFPHTWNFIYNMLKLLYLSGWSWFQFPLWAMTKLEHTFHNVFFSLLGQLPSCCLPFALFWLQTRLKKNTCFWEINISSTTAEFIICFQNLWICAVNEKILKNVMNIHARFSISSDVMATGQLMMNPLIHFEH